MRELPRRCYIDLMTSAELAIRNAVDEVEDMPADARLTEAVILLSQAREKVADYVDSQTVIWRDQDGPDARIPGQPGVA